MVYAYFNLCILDRQEGKDYELNDGKHSQHLICS
jgi:hypothetical protein